MWIVLILASLTIVLAQTIRVEAIAAANHISAVKAEAIAEGAISYIFSKLTSEEDSTTNYGSNPYEVVHLGDGYFWVIRPNLSDDKKYDYGLIDLAGRINLNSASLEILLKLPGMTSELAPSIIDWRDTDSEITQGGAENEYYLLLSEPYYCKNSPLETVEETLMIKGGDWKSLYGEDLNRNGVLDKGEDENGNGRLDYGFFNYVTVHSYQTNQDQKGEKRINVNDVENQSSIAEIIRQVVGENYYQVMNNIRMRRRFESLIDFYYATGMSYDKFNQIVDKLTTTDNEKLIGLINVNTAPSGVLLGLPGLEQSDVDSLIAKRKNDSTDLTNFLWVTQALSREKAVQIGRYITASSSQYSADIVGVSGDGRAFKRYYVIIDMAEGSPKVVYKQSLHHLGWPLDPKILENLRDKNGLG
jgi:type II secretory pathway component PulK